MVNTYHYYSLDFFKDLGLEQCLKVQMRSRLENIQEHVLLCTLYLNTNTKLSTSRYIAMIDDMVGAWKNNRQNTNVICMEITVIMRKYYIFHLNLITIMRWRFSSKYVLDVPLHIIQPVSHLSSQTLRCNYWDSPGKLLPIKTNSLQGSLVALQDGYTCTKCVHADSDPYKSKIVVTAGKLFLHRNDKALPL